MKEESIILELTDSEALVLFELLARDSEENALRIEDKAEQTVLWKVEGLLEKALSAPLKPNYKDLLQAARQRVRGDAK